VPEPSRILRSRVNMSGCMNQAALSSDALAASSDPWASSRLSTVGTTLAPRVTPEVPAMEVNPVIVLAAPVPVSMAASISRAVRSTMAWPITVAMASTL
jgi:hypothetical protein